jgi:hypothetical protein
MVGVRCALPRERALRRERVLHALSCTCAVHFRGFWPASFAAAAAACFSALAAAVNSLVAAFLASYAAARRAFLSARFFSAASAAVAAASSRARLIFIALACAVGGDAMSVAGRVSARPRHMDTAWDAHTIANNDRHIVRASTTCSNSRVVDALDTRELYLGHLLASEEEKDDGFWNTKISLSAVPRSWDRRGAFFPRSALHDAPVSRLETRQISTWHQDQAMSGGARS